MVRDERIDAYIASRAAFAQPILIWLRARMHAACPDAEETIKWSAPTFVYRGAILARFAAFKHHASFDFWNREAMATGREGEAMGQYGRITSLADLPEAPEMEARIREAAALIEAGRKPSRPMPKPEPTIPPELAHALADDGQAKATFDGFPPGQRREYCEWIAEAKRTETRARRVADAVQWLREGKRRNWKHESK